MKKSKKSDKVSGSLIFSEQTKKIVGIEGIFEF